MSLDVATLPRWYRCAPCEVSWHGTDQTCWSCLSDADVHLHYPEKHKDQVQTVFEPETVSGTPLTRFGPSVEVLPQAATG